MLHPALPQTFTKENLAQWITENKIDQREDVQQVDLTIDEIQELEHKSSVASRAMDNLESLLKAFKSVLNSGTPVNDFQEPQPCGFTIPPTVGLKTLELRRKIADQTIIDGYRTEITWVYGIPYPESEQILYFDIEGRYYPSHDQNMTPEQKDQFNMPMLRAIKKEETVDFMADGDELLNRGNSVK